MGIVTVPEEDTGFNAAVDTELDACGVAEKRIGGSADTDPALSTRRTNVEKVYESIVLK